MSSNLLKDVHRRYNPLRDSWVLCSPHRTQRPWQGQEEAAVIEKKPEYDPNCYLCPGNKRASKETNERYTSTFIFQNDYSAVNKTNIETKDESLSDDKNIFLADRVIGQSLVICFSANHSVTMADMSVPEIEVIIDAWKQVYDNACKDKDIKYCQIFENKGSAMGCSNPHPHGQAWITSVVPDEPQIEHTALAKYYQKNHAHLLEDYVEQELIKRERIVDENESFVVLVPFWALWPFETLLLSKKRISSVSDLSNKQKTELAEMLHSLTVRYDNLFKTSFPYSMGIHQAFTQYSANEQEGIEHLLFHFYPPLLRSATVRKFLVGFELLGMPQRDITPELAAQRLREQSTTHF